MEVRRRPTCLSADQLLVCSRPPEKNTEAVDIQEVGKDRTMRGTAGSVQGQIHEENDNSRARQGLPDGVIVSQRGSVALVRLSRPAKRNAIDAAMITGIETFFSDLPQETRAVILYGEGSDFSAGADLSLLEDASGASALRISRAWHRAFDRIELGNVPVIAVLHGAVIGGGLELAAAAHIRVAERSAYYALPEGMHGIFVGGGGAVRVPRLIGTARMMDMMLTGRIYSAEEGAWLGLSQYVVEDGQGLVKGIELAERIAANTVLSNFAMVQALPRIARSDPESGLLMESLMATLAISDAEAKARMNAFLEKRAPKVSPRPAAGE
jgi:enoyl-CoA hydratase/carnithine racemase